MITHVYTAWYANQDDFFKLLKMFLLAHKIVSIQEAQSDISIYTYEIYLLTQSNSFFHTLITTLGLKLLSSSHLDIQKILRLL